MSGGSARPARKYVAPIPEDINVRIELLPLEHAAHVERVGSLDPGQVILFRELVLQIPEGSNDRCPERGRVGNVYIDVLPRGSKNLQRLVLRRLVLRRPGPRVRRGELVDDIG